MNIRDLVDGAIFGALTYQIVWLWQEVRAIKRQLNDHDSEIAKGMNP